MFVQARIGFQINVKIPADQDGYYGIMGWWVFKDWIQNYKGFWAKILKGNYCVLWKLCLIYVNSLLLHQFTKYNDFLWGYWFLPKNLSNFLSLHWKLNNPYYQTNSFCAGVTERKKTPRKFDFFDVMQFHNRVHAKR